MITADSKKKIVLSWARSRMSQTVFSKAISLRSASWILDAGNYVTQNSGLCKARAQDSLALIALVVGSMARAGRAGRVTRSATDLKVSAVVIASHKAPKDARIPTGYRDEAIQDHRVAATPLDRLVALTRSSR